MIRDFWEDFKRDPWSWAAPAVGLLGCAVVVALFSYIMWFRLTHHCAESREVNGQCGGGTHCIVHGEHGACLVYHTDPTYPCTWVECVRWEKDR